VEKARAVEAIEVALKRGGGRLNVYSLPEDGETELWRFSTGLHCPESDLRYADPIPSAFSFNSAVGACEACRGFGRVIGVDYGLVIPDDKRTLRSRGDQALPDTGLGRVPGGPVAPGRAPQGIPRDTAWNRLTPEQQPLGDPWRARPDYKRRASGARSWYGVKRFFAYLESKAYKMHIRVLLSKYRSYTPNARTCGGARLQDSKALLWRLGSKAGADAELEPAARFLPARRGLVPGTARGLARPRACPT
jgi:excinuclease ABC subunit A